MDLLAAVKERTLLLDGAMGTELISRGFKPGGPPEEWNVSRPDEIGAIHAAYYAAGADIVQTNSFGGSRHKLAAYGAGGRAAELNEAAARIAVAVRDRDYPGRFVAGDIGPTGTFVAPMGDADPDELRDGFAEQAAALVAGGVDLIHIETMFDLVEARLAVEGVRRAAPDLPLMVSLAYKPSPRGYRTMMGVDPQTAADDPARPRGRRWSAATARSPPPTWASSSTSCARHRAGPWSRSPMPDHPVSRTAPRCTTRPPSSSPAWWPGSPATAPASSAAAAARRPPSSPPWRRSSAAERRRCGLASTHPT